SFGGGTTTDSGSIAGRAPQASLSAPINQANRIETVDGVAASGQKFNDLAGLASVTDRASPSSLQLTLENKLVKDTANDYVKNLSSIINVKRDVIWFVFAINGQLKTADVYASDVLVGKWWPRRLEVSAVDSIAEWKADEKYQPVENGVVKTFLRESQRGKDEPKREIPRTAVVKCEPEKKLYF